MDSNEITFDDVINNCRRDIITSCPKDSVRYGNSCYYFSTNTATWYDAERACFIRGGHLAIVESKQEDLFLINEVTKKKTNFWLDGTDEKVEGRWIWSSIQQGVSYTNWDKLDGEPDGKTGQNCLGIYKSSKGNYYKWYDLKCSPRKMNFICESKLQLHIYCFIQCEKVVTLHQNSMFSTHNNGLCGCDCIMCSMQFGFLTTLF
ncbi:hypothetical protein KUTeg_005782 [Tegillarca granosa]|uniref:C-type lectin domain-containing protein n=1 Tax=Tegillarca granosa TaxID=220873 RepID=A0ABQ9FLQ3_TEGGR|nr:hypothetical protein KUTeg_005782 [Tegillarca granosa]